MENESRFQQWISSISESLGEQEWFRQLKGKWEELDPQSQFYLKVASAGFSVLLLLVICISSIWSVHKLKNELTEKTELLQMIRNANSELRVLRESVSSAATAASASADPWPVYFTNTANTSGVGKENLTISDEKKGTSTDLAKETLFDLSLKHVSIRQLVRYAFSLENGQRPVKLRNMAIDTKADPAGYMDATLSVSAFNILPGK